MRSLHNIEKSAFHRGEYVGYAGGVWKITRGSSGRGWLARKDRDTRYAETLAELSVKLAAFDA